MSRFGKLYVFGVAFACVAAGNIYAQQKSNSSNPSLGDIARQLKAEKAKQPKPVMVITNDNIPGPAENSFGPKSTAKSSPTVAPKEKEPASPAQPHDAEYFRARLSTLQDQLDIHKRELNVLQQKLGQNQMQYYPNPQDSLMQQYSRSDVDKLTTEIEAKKQQIADDEKAIEDLHDQLRHEGGDPGWLR